MRQDDYQRVKCDQKERKARCIQKQRECDDGKVKANQNKMKAKSIAKQRVEDNQKVKADQNERKKLSRNKRKLADPVGLSKHENAIQIKRRKLWKAEDRLRAFKEATKYNAIFICSCCHRRLFEVNVEVITQKLKDSINERKFGHFSLTCVLSSYLNKQFWQ